jgi:hypothetical protein
MRTPRPFALALATVVASSAVGAPAFAQAQDLPPLPPPSAQPGQPAQPATGQPAPVVVQTAPAAQPSGPPEKRPSSGMGLVIAGAVLTGVGVLNLATSPLCKNDDLIANKKLQDTCFAAALVFGGVAVAVGVPLLIVGLSKHSTYEEWKKAHPGMAGLGVHAGESGAGVGYRVEF